MKKIAFVVYREWGYQIFKKIFDYQKIRLDFSLDTLIVSRDVDFEIEADYKQHVNYFEVDPTDGHAIHRILKNSRSEIVCLYSWSYIVDKELLDDFVCLCLHPSRLPQYRGGTPIQHQLVYGETDSAISIFKMNEQIDGGDIYQQASMSLIGTVHDIFRRMVDLGVIITQQLITDYVNDELKFVPQQRVVDSLVYKRRKPSQSEMSVHELSKKDFEEVNNLVRGLLSPYPNVFVKLGSGNVYIKRIEKYKKLPIDALLLSKTTPLSKISGNENLFLRLQKCYARLVDFYTKSELGQNLL